MKVFFTGSPRALKDTQMRAEHEAIYKAIEKIGATHLSRLVINADPDVFYRANQDDVLKHYNNTIECVKKADVVVAETSMQSMSMGYLVEKALSMNKPVVVVHRVGAPPFFFSGIEDDRLQILEYSVGTAESVIQKAFEYAINQQEVRFNFFISPAIGRYLDWISKVKKIPRSVYLRALIERDMRENTEFEDI